MRDPKRIGRILKKIGQLWHDAPDLRLGQLLENCVWPEAPRHDIFHFEDDLTEDRLDATILHKNLQSNRLPTKRATAKSVPSGMEISCANGTFLMTAEEAYALYTALEFHFGCDCCNDDPSAGDALRPEAE